jgi:hypothetical protein
MVRDFRRRLLQLRGRWPWWSTAGASNRWWWRQAQAAGKTQEGVRMTTTTSLVGYWIHILKGEYSKCGRIWMAVGAEHYLVRFRPHDEMPPSSSLLTISDLCDDTDYFVNFFDTEAAWQMVEDHRTQP